MFLVFIYYRSSDPDASFQVNSDGTIDVTFTTNKDFEVECVATDSNGLTNEDTFTVPVVYGMVMKTSLSFYLPYVRFFTHVYLWEYLF